MKNRLNIRRPIRLASLERTQQSRESIEAEGNLIVLDPDDDLTIPKKSAPSPVRTPMPRTATANAKIHKGSLRTSFKRSVQMPLRYAQKASPKHISSNAEHGALTSNNESVSTNIILEIEELGKRNRAGSVCLNSFRAVAKWISALVMPQPGLAAAR
jgi:hypothetical protein